MWLLVLFLCGWAGIAQAASVSSGGGGGAASGLNDSFLLQNEIVGATSANPFIAGNGTQAVELFGDPTLGSVLRPKPLGDSLWRIWTNFNGCIRDMEASGGTGASVFCIDPDAATPHDMYLFKTGYYPQKSVYLPAGYWDGDGTNCPSGPSAVTINSGPKLPTYICADSSSSVLHATLTLPPDYVAGSTLTIKQRVVQTAADTGTLTGTVDAQCRGNAETLSSTWGTAQTLSSGALTGSNATNVLTSPALTPTGGCNPGDLLSLRYTFTASSTTASATLHFVGFDLVYSSESLSH